MLRYFVVCFVLIFLMAAQVSGQGVGDVVSPSSGVSANLRSCPSTDCGVVYSGGSRMRLEVLDVEDGQTISGSTTWYHVSVLNRVDRLTGYIHSSLVTRQSANSRSTTTTTTTTTRNNTNTRNLQDIDLFGLIPATVRNEYPGVQKLTVEQSLPDDIEAAVHALITQDNQYFIIAEVTCWSASRCSISPSNFHVRNPLDRDDRMIFASQFLGIDTTDTIYGIRINPGQTKPVFAMIELEGWGTNAAVITMARGFGFSPAHWYTPTVLTPDEFEELILSRLDG